MVDYAMLKPSDIFNMDETTFQFNNHPGHVLAKKGSKPVSTVTSSRKGIASLIDDSYVQKDCLYNFNHIFGMVENTLRPKNTSWESSSIVGWRKFWNMLNKQLARAHQCSL